MYLFGHLAAILGLLCFSEALPAEPVKRANIGAPRNMVYVQTYSDASGKNISLLPLIQQNTGITHIELASMHVNSNPGDITLNDNNPNSTYWKQIFSEVATIQKAGVKVLTMLGGAGDPSFSRLCSKSGTNPLNLDYYTPLKSTLAALHLDGIDLDIEENVNLNCALALLRQFDADFGHEFILAMSPVATALMPVGVSISGFYYKTLDQKATSSTRPNGKLVSYYNCQLYDNWGDSSSPSDYESIINNGFIPSRVVMGVFSNPADGDGWYNISTYKSTIKQLQSQYPKFGGVIGWEYFNSGGSDGAFTAPWQWVQAIGQTLGTTKKT